MDPILMLALAIGSVAAAVLAHAAVSFVRPQAATPTPAPSGLPDLPVNLASLEAVVANPAVQAVLVDLLTAIDAKLEAGTANTALRQLERVAFGLVVARLKSLAPTPAAPPAPAKPA